MMAINLRKHDQFSVSASTFVAYISDLETKSASLSRKADSKEKYHNRDFRCFGPASITGAIYSRYQVIR